MRIADEVRLQMHTVHVRRSPAHSDGAWVSLVTPTATEPLQAIVAAVDPHLDVEVSGPDTDWTARVIETDTAAEEFAEVAVTRISGRATFVFEPRKSLPLRVVQRCGLGRIGDAL